MKIAPRLGCLALLAVGAVAAPEPKVEMTVQLPPFIIDRPAGPQWRYLRIPRFEILSRCNYLATEQLALAFHRANQLLGRMLPERLQLALDVPQVLIFYDRRLWLPTEQAAVATMLEQRDQAPADGLAASASRVRLEPVTGGELVGKGAAPDTHPAGRFFSNLMLADADAITTFALVTESSLDAWTSYLTSGYVRSLVESRVPALPAWFVAGFMGLHGRLDFRTQAMSLRLARWDQGFAPLAKGQKESDAVPLLLPWAELLADRSPASEDLGRWQAQCERLVAWGLDPEGGRQAAFATFIERAAAEPVTETLVRECLGLGWPELQAALSGYVTTSHTLRWELPDDAMQLPAKVGDASSLDVARIKGEWERLEARYVRKNQPALESRYVDLARKTLGKAYGRGERDPRLLASLGLLESEAGDKDAARAYLEAATTAGVVRPRAYFELARLRFDQLEGRSARNDGKFSAEQADAVLQPLFAGLKQSPPLVSAYVLMAYVATRSVEPPSEAVRSALAEGVRLFPHHQHLAELRAQLP